MGSVSMLDAVLDLAKQVGPVLPIAPKGKRPTLGEWQKLATRDAAKIREWYTRQPDGNVGLLTGTGAGFFVLDVDAGKAGLETLAALEADHGFLPKTWRVNTGGGGRHYFFTLPEGFNVRGSAGKIGAGLDVRGEGGQVVAPPSVHPSGTRYAWAEGASPWERNLAAAPEWLIDLLRAASEPPAPVLASAFAPPPAHDGGADKLDRARAYLATLPAAVSGSGGHEAAFLAAQRMVRSFALTEDDAFAVLWTDYNPRCSPPWSEKELRHKVKQAATRSGMEAGALLNVERPNTRISSAAPSAPATPTPAAKARRAPMTGGALLAKKVKPVEWLIAPWVPKDSDVLLVAPPNAGKTILALAFSGFVLGQGGRVFAIEEEGSEGGWQTRVRRALAAAGPNADPERFLSVWKAGLNLLVPSDRNWIAETAKGFGADLVILDSLAALTADADENDSREMKAVSDALNTIKTESGATLLTLHHSNKGSWVEGARPPSQADARGHGALAARIDTQLAIAPEAGAPEGWIVFNLHTTKQRDAEKAGPRRFAIRMDGDTATVEVENEGERKLRAERAEADVIEGLVPRVVEAVKLAGGGVQSTAFIRAGVGAKNERVVAAIKLAVERRLLVEVGKGRDHGFALPGDPSLFDDLPT